MATSRKFLELVVGRQLLAAREFWEAVFAYTIMA
jgi:hypothetical protein